MNKMRRTKAIRKENEAWEAEQDRKFKERMRKAKEAERRRMEIQFLTMLGESKPGMDCETAFEELVCGLKFARALRLDNPVTAGVTMTIDLLRRVFYECIRTSQMWLCEDGTLSERKIEADEMRPFDEVWVALPGSEVAISQEQLDAANAEINGGGQ